MVQRLIIESLCDVCEREGKETPAQSYRVDVTIEGEPESPKPFVVELCGAHGSDLAKAVLAVLSYGRPPDITKRTPRYGRPRAEGTRTRPDQRPEELTCPTCGHVAPSLSALRHHLRTEHDTSLAAVGIIPANLTCDDCGDGFPNGQGLAAHIRARHPDTWARRKKPA